MDFRGNVETHEFAHQRIVEIFDRIAIVQRQPRRRVALCLDDQSMVAKIEGERERIMLMRYEACRQTPWCNVERCVPGVIEPWCARQPDFADDLHPPSECVLGIYPSIVGQFGPSSRGFGRHRVASSARRCKFCMLTVIQALLHHLQLAVKRASADMSRSGDAF